MSFNPTLLLLSTREVFSYVPILLLSNSRISPSRVLKIYWPTIVFFQTRTVPSSLTPSSWPRTTSSPPTPNQSYPSGRTCSSSARGFPTRSQTHRHISSPMQLRRKLWWAQTIATRWKHSLVLIICQIFSLESVSRVLFFQFWKTRLSRKMFCLQIYIDNKRPQESHACPDQSRGYRAKKFMSFCFSKPVQFLGKTHLVCDQKNQLSQKALLTNKLLENFANSWVTNTEL